MTKQKKSKRQKNSSFIARATIENNEKFEIIHELYQKHKNMITEKHAIMRDILSILNLGFINLSRKKIFLGHIEGRPYYISTNGLSRSFYPNQIRNNFTETFLKSITLNTSISVILKEIVDIGNNKDIFLKKMNKRQKRIFKKFFKYSNLAKEEPKIILKTKSPVKIIELIGGFSKPYTYKVFNNISLTDYHIGSSKDYDFEFNMNKDNVILLRFSRLYLSSGINEKIFIEQTFNYMKTLLLKEINNREKELRRLKMFNSKIRNEFRDYLLLQKIEGGE